MTSLSISCLLLLSMLPFLGVLVKGIMQNPHHFLLFNLISNSMNISIYIYVGLPLPSDSFSSNVGFMGSGSSGPQAVDYDDKDSEENGQEQASKPASQNKPSQGKPPITSPNKPGPVMPPTSSSENELGPVKPTSQEEPYSFEEINGEKEPEPAPEIPVPPSEVGGSIEVGGEDNNVPDKPPEPVVISPDPETIIVDPPGPLVDTGEGFIKVPFPEITGNRVTKIETLKDGFSINSIVAQPRQVPSIPYESWLGSDLSMANRYYKPKLSF